MNRIKNTWESKWVKMKLKQYVFICVIVALTILLVTVNYKNNAEKSYTYNIIYSDRLIKNMIFDADKTVKSLSNETIPYELSYIYQNMLHSYNISQQLFNDNDYISGLSSLMSSLVTGRTLQDYLNYDNVNRFEETSLLDRIITYEKLLSHESLTPEMVGNFLVLQTIEMHLINLKAGISVLEKGVSNSEDPRETLMFIGMYHHTYLTLELMDDILNNNKSETVPNIEYVEFSTLLQQELPKIRNYYSGDLSNTFLSEREKVINDKIHFIDEHIGDDYIFYSFKTYVEIVSMKSTNNLLENYNLQPWQGNILKILENLRGNFNNEEINANYLKRYHSKWLETKLVQLNSFLSLVDSFIVSDPDLENNNEKIILITLRALDIYYEITFTEEFYSKLLLGE